MGSCLTWIHTVCCDSRSTPAPNAGASAGHSLTIQPRLEAPQTRSGGGRQGGRERIRDGVDWRRR